MPNLDYTVKCHENINNELSVEIKNSDGKIRTGNIGELVSSLGHYYDDALKFVKKSLESGSDTNISENRVRRRKR